MPLSPRQVPTHRTLAQRDHLYRPIVEKLTAAERIAIAEREAERWESMAGDMARAAQACRECGHFMQAGAYQESADQYGEEARAYRSLAAEMRPAAVPALSIAAE